MINTNTNEARGFSTRELTGAIWQGSSDTASAAQFHWQDEESGQLLKIRVEGDESFFRGLENLGFIRHPTKNSEHKTTKTPKETPRRTSGCGPKLPGWQDRRRA